jgi:Zn-finger nucleic acid-binding protein
MAEWRNLHLRGIEMNKCLQCTNMQIRKTEKGVTCTTCSKCRGVIVYGELGAEPIVEDCGAFRQLRVYRKDGRK